MYAARPDNICLESSSLPLKAFQNVLLISITIFISYYLHFLFKCKLFEDLCQSQNTTKYYVTKRKSLQYFDQRISSALLGNLQKSKQFSVVLNWKREWIKINKTKRQLKNRYLHFCFRLPKGKTEKH